MKKFTLIAGIILFFLSSTQVFSQTKNFVISTGSPHHVPLIIKSANTLAETYKDHLGKIEIVLYGKAVDHLDRPETSQPWLNEVESEAISFKACEIALKKRNLDRKMLPKSFNTVPDALVYILKLKDKGYIDFDF